MGQPDSLALGLFIFAMLQTIILGIYTVLSPMIQALFQNRKAIIYFGYGVLVKLILQIPFIYLFRAYGPLLATTVGLDCSNCFDVPTHSPSNRTQSKNSR